MSGLTCRSCARRISYRALAHYLVCRAVRQSPCCDRPRLGPTPSGQPTPKQESGGE